MELTQLEIDKFYTFTGFVRDELSHEIGPNNVDAHSNYYIKPYINKIMQFQRNDGDGYYYFLTSLLNSIKNEDGTFNTYIKLDDETGKEQDIEICFADPNHDNLCFKNKECQYYFKNIALFK
jgi:hypothetical protein